MTSAAATVALTALAAKVAGFLPAGCTGAGDPVRRSRRVINGHLVQVEVIGHAGERTEFTMPYNTGTLVRPLADVAAAIAD